MSIIKSRMKRQHAEDSSSKPTDLALALSMKKRKAGAMQADSDEPQGPASVADAIMQKRKAKMMAEGGMVDIQDNGSEDPNSFDEQNEDAAGMKELYDDSQLEAQPEDSNEHGDDISDDLHDMVSQIRKKMAAKRGM